MILYIVRHAIAVPASRSEEEDSRRPLTPKGRRKMLRIARGLKKLQAQIDLILTSPYLRAAETGGILAKTIGLNEDQVVSNEHLSPAGYPDRLVHDINAEFGNQSSIALIGHEPSLTSLVAVLLSGDPTLSVTLKKGGVCKLSTDRLLYDRCATFEWLLSPAQLAEIGA